MSILSNINEPVTVYTLMLTSYPHNEPDRRIKASAEPKGVLVAEFAGTVREALDGFLEFNGKSIGDFAPRVGIRPGSFAIDRDGDASTTYSLKVLNDFLRSITLNAAFAWAVEVAWARLELITDYNEYVTGKQIVSDSKNDPLVRDRIIRQLLRDIGHDADSTARQCEALKNMGFDWPELDTILASASHDSSAGRPVNESGMNTQPCMYDLLYLAGERETERRYTVRVEALVNGGRNSRGYGDTAMAAFERAISKFGADNQGLVPDVQRYGWPGQNYELGTDNIVRMFVTGCVNGDRKDHLTILGDIAIMRHLGHDRPEFATIERSLRHNIAEGWDADAVTYSVIASKDSYTVMGRDANGRTQLSAKSADLDTAIEEFFENDPNTGRYTVALLSAGGSGRHIPADPHGEGIDAAWLDAWQLPASDTVAMARLGSDFARALGQNPTISDDMIKHKAMSRLLLLYANEGDEETDSRATRRQIERLRELGCDWPELALIEKSLNHK